MTIHRCSSIGLSVFLSACAVSPDDDPTSTATSALSTHSVTITSAELAQLGAALNGTILSIDTTESAPELFGPLSTYPNPAWELCQQQLAACSLEPFAARAQCRADVHETCANVPHSITSATIEYSYLEFTPLAQALGARNVYFPLTTLHHDGAISFDFDINYIHATFGANFTLGFTNGSATNSAAVWLFLTGIQSNSPTIITSNGPVWMPLPDIDFFNMVAGANLDGLRPTPDGLGVDYSGTIGYFDFDWHANNMPDVLLSAFVDVNTLVSDRVGTRIAQGFDQASSHTAISAKLTELVAADIKKVSPNGYSQITGIVGIGAGSIRVDYVAK